MIALRIDIDGESYITAAAEDWSTLSAAVTLFRGENGSPVPSTEVEVSVGAHAGPDSDGTSHHLRWPEKLLSLGSVITISVVETGEVQPPSQVRALPKKEADG